MWGERAGSITNIHPSCSEPWCRHSSRHSWFWLGFPAECGGLSSSFFFQRPDQMDSTCCLSECGVPDSRVRLILVPQSVPLFQGKSTSTRFIILPNLNQWLPSLCLSLCPVFPSLAMAMTCSSAFLDSGGQAPCQSSQPEWRRLGPTPYR